MRIGKIKGVSLFDKKNSRVSAGGLGAGNVRLNPFHADNTRKHAYHMGVRHLSLPYARKRFVRLMHALYETPHSRSPSPFRHAVRLRELRIIILSPLNALAHWGNAVPLYLRSTPSSAECKLHSKVREPNSQRLRYISTHSAPNSADQNAGGPTASEWAWCWGTISILYHCSKLLLPDMISKRLWLRPLYIGKYSDIMKIVLSNVLHMNECHTFRATVRWTKVSLSKGSSWNLASEEGPFYQSTL